MPLLGHHANHLLQGVVARAHVDRSLGSIAWADPRAPGQMAMGQLGETPLGQMGFGWFWYLPWISFLFSGPTGRSPDVAYPDLMDDSCLSR